METNTEPSEKSLNKRGVLFTLIAVAFMDYVSIGLVYPLFTSLIFDPNANFLPKDASQALRGLSLGVLFSLMPLVQFFSAPLLGAISDAKGRKSVLAITLFIGLLGYCIAVLGVHFERLSLLIFSRIMLGISGGSAAVVQAILSDIGSKEEKPRYFSLFNMALGAGLTVGPFLGGKLSSPEFFSMGSYELPFWFAAWAIFCNLLLVLCLLKSEKKENHQLKMPIDYGIKNIKRSFYVPGLRILFVCAFIFCFGWSFFIEFIPVYLMGKYAFRSPDIGNFYAYSSAVYALSCGIFIRPIIKHFSTYHVLFFGLLFSGSYALVFLWIEQAFYVWLYFPFLLFFIALIFPTLTTMISQEASESEQGTILGILQSVQSIAFALSPLFSGALVGIYPFMPVVVGGMSMLLSSTIFGYFFLFQLREKNHS